MSDKEEMFSFLDGASEGYKQGRIDAIEEFKSWYIELMNNPPSVIIPYNTILDKLEQLKEQTS